MKHIEEYTAWCFIKNVVPLKDRGKLKEIFDRIPAANVKPVVHGKWEHDTVFSLPHCSNCFETNRSGETAFCPSCGSDMREGKE